MFFQGYFVKDISLVQSRFWIVRQRMFKVCKSIEVALYYLITLTGRCLSLTEACRWCDGDPVTVDVDLLLNTP